jgi:hypothetical protein
MHPGGVGKDLLKATVGEDASGLINLAQEALTVATVARTVLEAEEFEKLYPRALKKTVGKHFLLNMRSRSPTRTTHSLVPPRPTHSAEGSLSTSLSPSRPRSRPSPSVQ